MILHLIIVTTTKTMVMIDGTMIMSLIIIFNSPTYLAEQVLF